MIGRRGFQTGDESSNGEEYDKLFVLRVHSVLKSGYDRLEPSKYASAEETAITGDLVREIEGVLEYPAESWMRFLRVHDDPPVNTPRRKDKPTGIGKGRARKRVDIKLDCSKTSPYTRFHFESKRLGEHHSAANYLGTDGLGRFLSGDYAAEESRSGMLGYVEQDDESTWASRIERMISTNTGRFQITKTGNWQRQSLVPDFTHSYSSCHLRSAYLGQIRIYHSLLGFH